MNGAFGRLGNDYLEVPPPPPRNAAAAAALAPASRALARALVHKHHY